MPKLTKKIIDASASQSKDYIVWDSDIKGFGCRIYPSGIKTYVFFYRHPKKRQKVGLKIGKHGNVTPDGAREIAQGWAGDVARGIDPKEYKQEQTQQSLTIREFSQIYLEKCASVQNKPKTFKDYQGWLRRDILPRLGSKKLTDVTRQDIYDFHRSISKKTTANRCLAVLSKMYSFAKELNYYEKENPFFRFKKHKENKIGRILNTQEFTDLNRVLNYQEMLRFTTPYVISAIRMLIYTGCRKNEILTLKWEDVHLEKDYIHVKDSKTGEKIVPLNKFSKSVLESLKKQPDNPYIFCGAKPGTHLTDIKKTWYKIRGMIGIENVRMHDLRHTFASMAIDTELDIFGISKLLGHKDIKTTMNYIHLIRASLVRSAKIVESAFEKI